MKIYPGGGLETLTLDIKYVKKWSSLISVPRYWLIKFEFEVYVAVLVGIKILILKGYASHGSFQSTRDNFFQLLVASRFSCYLQTLNLKAYKIDRVAFISFTLWRVTLSIFKNPHHQLEKKKKINLFFIQIFSFQKKFYSSTNRHWRHAIVKNLSAPMKIICLVFALLRLKCRFLCRLNLGLLHKFGKAVLDLKSRINSIASTFKLNICVQQILVCCKL